MIIDLNKTGEIKDQHFDICIVGSGPAGITLLYIAGNYISNKNDPFYVWLLSILGGTENARMIGARYLSLNYANNSGVEKNINRLLETKFSEIHFNPEYLITFEELKEQIKSEYLVGKIENVDGWILSKTETCLCALACLYDQSSVAQSHNLF